MFFRGYVETNGKTSIEKIKDRNDFKTYEQVKLLPEFGGVLADDVILVDVDDYEQSEILLKVVSDLKIKCRVYKTQRGKHFLFKNEAVKSCSTTLTLAIGIKADIKIGRRHSYEVLKLDGHEREILVNCDEPDLLPKYLMPIKAETVFLNLDAGEGRNNALFQYELTLQANDFSIDEARQCIEIINDYVLKEPLSNEELQVILRDEAFKKPVFFKGNQFLHDKFATFIKNNNHIIKINNQLHTFKNGIYVNGSDEIESVMISHLQALSRAKRTEVLAYLNILIMNNTPIAPPNLIAFRNGIYNLDDDSLTGITPEIVVTNRIPWDYNPNAYSEIADKTLNKIACHDEQIRQILEQVIGACFYRSSTLGGGKAFILIGEGANGKSTFLSMIQDVLGEDNIAALDLKELDAKFQNAELFGKLANIGDDISDEFIVNASIFKKLVTGNRIQVQRKGERPFDFNNYATMLFSANNIPRIKDKTGAVLRRMLIIPFDAKFSVDDADYDENITFKLKSQETMEYLIRIGLAALKEVIANHKFTESEKITVEIEEYEEINNPVKAFISECDDEKYDIKYQPVPVVFEKYSCFCIRNGCQSVSKIEFTRQIRRLKPLDVKMQRVRNEQNPVRVFVPRGE